ncbi:unnamed protein product [Caretta caretta]
MPGAVVPLEARYRHFLPGGTCPRRSFSLVFALCPPPPSATAIRPPFPDPLPASGPGQWTETPACPPARSTSRPGSRSPGSQAFSNINTLPGTKTKTSLSLDHLKVDH